MVCRRITVAAAISTISNWERGHQSPEPRSLQRLSDVMKIPTQYFVRKVPNYGSCAIFFRSLANPLRAWDGEDGPTHQPVDQVISLRAIPGLVVLRPGDANGSSRCYRYVLHLRHRPAVIALSRQPLPTFDRRKYASAAGVARGAYFMADATARRQTGRSPIISTSPTRRRTRARWSLICPPIWPCRPRRSRPSACRLDPNRPI
jgi:transcriptional regulator with XRE-family HTH domain